MKIDALMSTAERKEQEMNLLQRKLEDQKEIHKAQINQLIVIFFFGILIHLVLTSF
jgi:hypothetical protein